MHRHFPSRLTFARLILAPLAIAVALATVGPAWGQQRDKRDQLVADYRRAEKLHADGRDAEAARLYESITATAERLFGLEHRDTANLLRNRALVLQCLERYPEAEALYSRCIQIAEARFPDDPCLPRFQTNLGELCRLTGQLEKAEVLVRGALRLREKLGPGHDAEVAESLHFLAVLCQEKGDLTAAEPLYERCLKVREEKLGPNDPAVADTLDLMGQLYGQLGQDSRALALYTRALKIREDRFGPNHLATAATLNDLAVHYLNRSKFAEAEPLFRRALKIFEGHYGPDHTDTAKMYHNLSWICLNRNKVEEAERLQARAVQAWSRKLSANHPLLAQGLSNQAVLYFVTGRTDQAESLQRRALKMREQSLGPDHPNVADNLGRLAGVLAAAERWHEAAETLDRSRRVLRRYTTRVLPALSEPEQWAFLQQQHAPDLHAALSLAWQRPDDEKLVELSAAWVLNGKGVAQEVVAAQTLLARDSSDPDVLQTLAQLREVRGQVARLTAIPDSASGRRQRGGLAARETELVKGLGRTTGRSLDADPWVGLDQVRRTLADNTVLIEIARFPVWDLRARTPERSWGEARYAAWIIPARGRGPVRLLDLRAASEVEGAVRRVRQALQEARKAIHTKGRIEAEKELARELEALALLVLRPLEKYASGAEHWVISADAALWLVPWAALPLTDGRYAVEQYRLSYVVSGRDLASPQPVRPQRTDTPVVLAAPDYDLRPDDAATDLGPVGPKVAQRSASTRRTPASLAEIPAVRALPGTEVEAEEIAPRLERYAGRKPRLYLRKQAQESVMKSLRGPQVVVLSTHAFFLPDQGSPDATATTGEGQLHTNPLLRCGVLLAGCNRRQQARSDEEDGILTGLEIVGCDLRGCELVVLSACETGLGDVRNGEGVAGLRQAFQLAGARAVVATLWQVPDRETANLMIGFFDNLAGGQGKAEALRNAQLKLIKEWRDRNEAAHPFFWAAFILTGR